MGELLDLNLVEPERDFVTLRNESNPEGVRYELKAYTELSPEDMARLHELAKKAERMQDELPEELDEVPIAELNQLGELMDRMLDIAFYSKLDDEMRESMTLQAKSVLVAHFSEAFSGYAANEVKVSEDRQKRIDRMLKAQGRTTRKKARTASRSGASS